MLRSPAALTVTLLVVVGLGGAPARAATSSSVEAFLAGASFQAGAGQANDLTVTVSPRSPIDGFPAWQFRFDDTFPITPGENCFRPGDDATVAVCDVHSAPPSSPAYAAAYLGDGDDRITATGTGDGEAGDDVLTGAGGAQDLRGGPGDDRVSGAGGDDLLFGNSGDDTLLGGTGRDGLSGGSGRNDLHP